MTLLQRFKDWQRERRIRRLRERACYLMDVGQHQAAQHVVNELFLECDARSRQQRDRMERARIGRMDPHARAVFERARGRR